MIHLLMQAEFGVPVLPTLFREITPPVILAEIAALFAHEATLYGDLTYAVPRRAISPIEQQVHAWLEPVPSLRSPRSLPGDRQYWGRKRAVPSADRHRPERVGGMAASFPRTR